MRNYSDPLADQAARKKALEKAANITRDASAFKVVPKSAPKTPPASSSKMPTLEPASSREKIPSKIFKNQKLTKTSLKKTPNFTKTSVVTKTSPLVKAFGPAKPSSLAKTTPKKTTSSDYDLYIIHGWTYTVEPWTNTLAILKHNGLKVKMLHVPGLTEKSSKVFTIDDYVAWADREIPDGALALGHSNGGRILLNLCAKKPEKLGSLILLDSAGVYEARLKKRVVAKVAKLGRPLKKFPLIDQAFHKITGSTDYSRAPANMKTTLQNMLESDKTLDFSKITTRTYILWGKKDTTTPPRQATALYEKLVNSELKFYARWTHAPYISNPRELAEVLTALVKRIN